MKELEQRIIKGLITNRSFAKAFLTKVNGKQFEDLENQTLIEVITKFTKKYHKIPSKQKILDFINNKKNKLDVGKVTDSLNALDDLIIEDWDILVTDTGEYLTRQNLVNLYIETTDQISTGSFNYDDIKRKTHQCEVSPIKGTKAKSTNESYNKFIQELSKSRNIIPTGDNWLDRVMNGGWHRRTVNVVCSEANCGKTLLLLNWCRVLAERGLNGLFISYEIDKHKILERFYSSVSGIPTHDLKNNIEQLARSYKVSGELDVDHLPDGSSTADLEDRIIQYSEEITTQIDFICVDYIGCLTSPNVDQRSGSYEKFGAVVTDLKSIADKWDVPLFTAHQINRSGYGAAAGMDHIGDSMKIAHKADNVFFLTKFADINSDDRLVNLKLDKTRVSGYNGFNEYYRFHKPTQKTFCDVTDEMKQQAIDVRNNDKKEKKGY